jgi:hypothetical protein
VSWSGAFACDSAVKAAFDWAGLTFVECRPDDLEPGQATLAKTADDEGRISYHLAARFGQVEPLVATFPRGEFMRAVSSGHGGAYIVQVIAGLVARCAN